MSLKLRQNAAKHDVSTLKLGEQKKTRFMQMLLLGDPLGALGVPHASPEGPQENTIKIRSESASQIGGHGMCLFPL